ncbi:hypothetical protein AB0D49_17655 [Streptomyces sp. NPDC048290]|uniref:hypothetical protein n=1 Tax=Streptomyces sp. NPDC048290 TaxID=3155811 RepID=UPI00342BEC29
MPKATSGHPVSGQRADVAAAAQSSDSPAALPDGWTSFRSKSDGGEPPHWYATAPYDVDALRDRIGADRAGDPAWNLAHTVDAPSLPELRARVAEQVALHRALVGGES